MLRSIFILTAFFLFMPVYSRPELSSSFGLKLGTLVTLVVLLGVIYYWVTLGLPLWAVAVGAIAVFAFTYCFLIVPGYKRAETTKPVPERVTQ